jgi:hypothetical protein
MALRGDRIKQSRAAAIDFPHNVNAKAGLNYLPARREIFCGATDLRYFLCQPCHVVGALVFLRCIDNRRVTPFETISKRYAIKLPAPTSKRFVPHKQGRPQFRNLYSIVKGTTKRAHRRFGTLHIGGDKCRSCF